MAEFWEYAVLASHAYSDVMDDADQAYRAPPGFAYIDQISTPTGLFARAFRDLGTGEIVISVRGTEFDQANDLIADVTLGLGINAAEGEANQVTDLAEFVRGFVFDEGNENVVMTGHSLGGGLAALMVGVGTLGNIVASYPTTLAAETMGWRAALWVLCGLTALTAAGIWRAVHDPVKEASDRKGSFAEVLRIRALWFIFPLMLVSYAELGALRGLWVGPYLTEVFDAAPRLIGQATLAMGICMVIGPMAYSPLDRMFGTRKWVVFAGSLAMLASTVALLVMLETSVLWAVILMCAIGFFGSTYPAIMAHGRSLLPRHLVGRGVTLLNLCSIGGVGIAQFVTGRIYATSADAAVPAAPYTLIFGFFIVALAAGITIYLFSSDTKPDPA